MEKNIMAQPKVKKIVVNMGTGEALKNKDVAEKIINDLSQITGQKPKITRAKTSIAGFNLREGTAVGLTVTLRGARMTSFFDKLTKVVLPRLRDFRGVPLKSFDKSGNYTLAVIEHTVFPEIDLAKVDKPRGMEVTIVIGNATPESSLELLKTMGMPFERI